jgi:hypothetical protein
LSAREYAPVSPIFTLYEYDCSSRSSAAGLEASDGNGVRKSIRRRNRLPHSGQPRQEPVIPWVSLPKRSQALEELCLRLLIRILSRHRPHDTDLVASIESQWVVAVWAAKMPGRLEVRRVPYKQDRRVTLFDRDYLKGDGSRAECLRHVLNRETPLVVQPNRHWRQA